MIKFFKRLFKSVRVIDFASEFSSYPGGADFIDGDYSGGVFRESLLIPALRYYDLVVVNLDGNTGFSWAFLSHAFGALVENGNYHPEELLRRIEIESLDVSLAESVRIILRDAKKTVLDQPIIEEVIEE